MASWVSVFEFFEELIIVGDEETEDTRKNSTVSLSKSQLRKMVRVVTV